MQLIGPITQILSLADLPLKGPLKDDQLRIVSNGGILIKDELIKEVGIYSQLLEKHKSSSPELHKIDFPAVALPGFIDCHTHICYSGSRAMDFALRNAGATYLEIAKSGGGIWDTVQKTRKASLAALTSNTLRRASSLLKKGITTIEVKSGYGLSKSEELKMLQAISQANSESAADLIPTCLAAHIFPKDYPGSKAQYLQEIANELFPIIRKHNLCNRVDAFVEESAFSASEIEPYLIAAQNYNFDITIHADQFSTSGSKVAIKYNAVSADHLEASQETEIKALANSNTVATVLPGASLGLGMPFAPARQLLDQGGLLAIASDWNPGSAPMGDLITQASILATYEHLSSAEVFAGITYRAAKALNVNDRGQLKSNYLADFNLFPTSDFREILYQQGQLQPIQVWKNGRNHIF